MTEPGVAAETASAAAGGPDGGDRVRVLHLVKGLNAGGTETLLVLAARHRDRTQFAYEVAYLRPDHVALQSALQDKGVPTTCLVRSRWWDPRWLGRLRRRLQGQPADIVHAHSPLTASGARMVLWTLPAATRPRMVVTLHNVWASHHPAVRLLDRLTYRRDDLRLAVSEGARKSLPRAAARRAVTQIHGVNVASLRKSADRAAARKELEVADDEILVGTVANPSLAKGYHDLLAAARTVCAARPAVRFVAIGQGPLLATLQAHPDRIALGDRFQFLGHRKEASRLVSGFDVFCLPSHHEGLPLALMEALVLGIPVVVTKVGGMGELVTSGQEGLLVPPARPELLAEALLSLIDDPDRRAELAIGAAATGSTLDAAASVTAVEARYVELLGDRGRGPEGRRTLRS